MRTISLEYDFGDLVYLITDKEQDARVVTGALVRKGVVLYYISCGAEAETLHYGYEITKEHDPLKGL